MTSKTNFMLLTGAFLLAAPAGAQTDPAPATAPVAAAAPAAPVEAAPTMAGLIAPPPPGKGQVVFYRRGTMMGALISCAVSEEGTKLSSLSPGKYFVQVVEPGIHSFSVQSEAKDVLRMEVEAGQTYYASCAITMGFMAGRPNLSPSDEPTFSSLSAKLKLVAPAT